MILKRSLPHSFFHPTKVPENVGDPSSWWIDGTRASSREERENTCGRGRAFAVEQWCSAILQVAGAASWSSAALGFEQG